MKFEPRLDAYRGFCIALVFLQHWAALDCGWVGVQAFFVLSGYLITGILRRERAAATPADFFVNFYARRVLRIFPLYFGYLLLLVVVVDVIKPGLLEVLAGIFNPSLPFLLTYTQNFYRIVSGISSPFYSHLWSLSIEEQFYLVWPLVVFLLGPRKLLAVCLALIAAALVIRFGELEFQLHTGIADKAHAGVLIYYFTGSHIDAFAFGALLTYRQESPGLRRVLPIASRWIPILFIVSGAWMIVLGKAVHYGIGLNSLGWPLYLPQFYGYVWGFTLINALFFIVLANIDRLHVLVDLRALQRLGKVSYGFYVFHCPIVRLTKYFMGDLWSRSIPYDLGCLVIAFAISWGLAELSFRFFEQPIMRLKRRFPGVSNEAGAGEGTGLATPAVTPSPG